jgi:CheY-like chemotaxis protein
VSFALHKILLIDDEEGLGKIVRFRLQNAIDKAFPGWGVEMTAVTEWKEGDRLARTGEFDIVLLDLAIPPMHPTDTMSMLPRVAQEWCCPIIIFTGTRDDEVRQRCIMLGAASFFLKDIFMVQVGGAEALLQDCLNTLARRRRQGI